MALWWTLLHSSNRTPSCLLYTSVKPEEVSEDNMILLARDVAKKIEAELEYPGQIKVNVIRETKAVEYAK